MNGSFVSLCGISFRTNRFAVVTESILRPNFTLFYDLSLTHPMGLIGDFGRYIAIEYKCTNIHYIA